MGDAAQQLGELFINKKVALISNALDFSTDLERRKKSTQTELKDLKSIGLEPESLDLRDYFGKKAALKEKLNEFGGVWVRGGNTFLLRRAMKYSGFDELILEKRGDPDFVYAGYSAGACVITPTLKGIDFADDAHITPDGYSSEIIWEGLNLVSYSIAPHYKSDHPESELIEKSIEYFKANNMQYRTLRDGETIIETVS